MYAQRQEVILCLYYIRWYKDFKDRLLCVNAHAFSLQVVAASVSVKPLNVTDSSCAYNFPRISRIHDALQPTLQEKMNKWLSPLRCTECQTITNVCSIKRFNVFVPRRYFGYKSITFKISTVCWSWFCFGQLSGLDIVWWCIKYYLTGMLKEEMSRGADSFSVGMATGMLPRP